MSTRPDVQLYLPWDEVEALFRIVDKGRGRHVRIERATLMSLLMDHSALHKRMGDLGQKVIARNRT